MTSGAFGIGTSALTSLQTAIKTTSQNIANVNTEGYSKQFVEFGVRQPQRQGGFFVGQGTEVSTIRRSFDQFLNQDFQARTSSSAFFSSLSETAGRIDELFADPATGIGPALNEFFASMEAVANSPTTLPERQVMIATAETLAQRFSNFDTRLSEFQTELNIKVETSATDINQFAISIAELNEAISLQSAATNGLPSSDLLDQRDQTIADLSQLISTTTQTQDDGSINVFIGKGQPLVIGAAAGQIAVQPDDLVPNRVSVFISSAGQTGIEITSLLNGGEIGASLAAAEDIIETTRRDIGVLAAGLAVTFNQVHREGYALDGVTDQVSFFSPLAVEPTPPSQISGSGSVTISATFDDPADPGDDSNIGSVTGDSYRLSYAGGVLSALNLTNGARTVTDVITGLPANPTPTGVLDGVTLTIDNPADLADGQVFFFAPTSGSAAAFNVNIDDPNQVAAAKDPASPGDNRNLLSLIELQSEPKLNGNASFNEFYTNTTSSIAVQARRASSLAETEGALLASADARKSNVQGVNLEEEAANLIRFQQAFQAAAQVITTARDIFDVLIRATDR